MAFTGTPVVKQVSGNVCRITGISLGLGASGTISLHGGTGAVKLPAGFQPGPYAAVTLQDAVDVDAKPAAAGATAIPVQVTKTGTTPTDFLATLTNGSGTNSPALEIYAKFHS